MFLQRSAFAAARRVAIRPVARRAFTTSFVRRDAAPASKKLEEIKSDEDLIPQGAAKGTIPSDLEQATGLERLEILGKMQGVDIFDLKPLDSSRRGTLENPIVVQSAGEEQYIGCTGSPADSHITIWITTSKDRPIERCSECGSVYKMEYIGAADDHHGHGHDHHGVEEPKTFADFVKPEYR